MSKLMIIVGSTRPGRVGLPVGEWVRDFAAESSDFEVDFVDLVDVALPFLDEPAHPATGQYTKPHTKAWSARVGAADAFIFISPEYNHSYVAPLKNAIDFLNREWRRKPVGFVSYGGVSAGSRGVSALEPVLTTVGLVKTLSNVEIPFAGARVTEGVFSPSEKELAVLTTMLGELGSLAESLKSLR